MTNEEKMINELAEHIVLDEKIKDVLKVVDREFFSSFYTGHVSTLDAIQMGNGRWIQSLLTIVKIVQYLELKKSDKVLEIGCSSGYQTSILSKMCQEIYTVDFDITILTKAQKIFETIDINNIYPILSSGEKDWEPKETFDRIIFALSVEEVPNIYFDKLAEDGIIIAPLEVRDNYQILTKYHKKNGVISIESIEQCLFVSLSDIKYIQKSYLETK